MKRYRVRVRATSTYEEVYAVEAASAEEAEELWLHGEPIQTLNHEEDHEVIEIEEEDECLD